MKLTDQQLREYVSGRLALPGEERNEHRNQVNRLLEKLAAVLENDTTYKIQKFRRAGSLEKGTTNRPRAGRPVDADVGIYFSVEDTSRFDISDLQRRIKKLLIAAYPQKNEEDFDDSAAKTFGVVFKGSGLEVDLVPIVSLDDDADYGLQYSRAGDCVKTSIKVQLDHYRDHASRDPLLPYTLRVAKAWRHWQELQGVQSFHLELALSYLIDRDGPASGLEESVRRLFLFVIRDLDAGIRFTGSERGSSSDPVVIADPSNDENNVASRITKAERDALIKGAQLAYETITWSQGLPGKGETIAAWRELLGPSFSID